MNLGSPWMLLLLGLVPLAAWLAARSRRMQHDASCRLRGVAPQGGRLRLGRRDRWALAALGCTVLALARPQWNPQPYDVERKGRDLVIALDVSRSMLAADLAPSRLEAARIAIHEALPALAGQRLALITFSGSAAVRVPLTLDHGFVRYMLERADPSDVEMGSTSLQAACEKAVGTVLSDAAAGRRDLVLLTDGEDHLSDIDKTAAMLAQCGARVLIVGLGDPVTGGRVPESPGAKQWLRHNDAEVVSRLDDATLRKLSAKASNVTYYPARTRPFDLAALYQRMISGASDDVVVGEMRLVHYTQGYPYLLALAVALWLASSWKLPRGAPLLLLVLVLPGCGRPAEGDGEAAFQNRFQQGDELLQHAEEQSAADLSAARSLVLDAREAFLRAGLLRPGDIETARKITAATRRLRELDAALEKRHAEEKKRGEGLAKIIERLERITLRQARLGQQSAQQMRRGLVPPKADLSESSDRDNEMDAAPTEAVPAQPGNNNRLAQAAATEQQAVRKATGQLLEAIVSHRETLRQLLNQAYGNPSKLPPTELDPVADLLAESVDSQQKALTGLASRPVKWPQVNTAFHVAAGRMQQALEALRSQQPPVKDQEKAGPPAKDGEYHEDLEGADSDADGKKSQPMPAGDFASALSLDSLPVPNYSPADIIAEEAANQQKRAKQKAVRAGARVEKNW